MRGNIPGQQLLPEFSYPQILTDTACKNAHRSDKAKLGKAFKLADEMIVPLFLRKIFPGILLEKSAKITRQPLPSAAPAVLLLSFYAQQGA